MGVALVSRGQPMRGLLETWSREERVLLHYFENPLDCCSVKVLQYAPLEVPFDAWPAGTRHVRTGFSAMPQEILDEDVLHDGARHSFLILYFFCLIL